MKHHDNRRRSAGPPPSTAETRQLDTGPTPDERAAPGSPPIASANVPALDSFLDKLMLWAIPPVNGKPSNFEQIARRMARQLDPQDPAEEMLVAQMVATCFRAVRLSREASALADRRWADLRYNHADRAYNLFRRQMQTLIDYRRPRSSSFTSIRNANFAAQQVIQSTVADRLAPPSVNAEVQIVEPQRRPF